MLEANPPPECDQVTGSVANGAGCAAAAQCQWGFCAIVPGAACGTCAPPPGAGDSCAQLTTCGMGLSCDGDSNTCVAPPGQGASCAPGQSCALGLECIGENASTGAIGTCQPAVESGGACSSTTAECDFFAGFTCDDDSKTCVAVPVVAGTAVQLRRLARGDAVLRQRAEVPDGGRRRPGDVHDGREHGRGVQSGRGAGLRVPRPVHLGGRRDRRYLRSARHQRV